MCVNKPALSDGAIFAEKYKPGQTINQLNRKTYHDGLSELIEPLHVLKKRRVTLFGNGWQYVYKPDLVDGWYSFFDGAVFDSIIKQKK